MSIDVWQDVMDPVIKQLMLAEERFPGQVDRLRELWNMIWPLTESPAQLRHFADNMVLIGNNPRFIGGDPQFGDMFSLMHNLVKEGVLPEQIYNNVNKALVEMCDEFGILKTAAQAAAMSFGMGLVAVMAGFALTTVALDYVAPEGFFEPEDNPLLPEDTEEDLERFRQGRIEEKIKNNEPFCQYNLELDRCLPSSESKNDDESNCYVKDRQCKVNKGWVTGAYNWWKGINTDTPLFYKNQDGTLIPLTSENYQRQAYNADGSLYKDDWECPICYDPALVGLSWTISGIVNARGQDECGHKYHTACIERMMEVNRRQLVAPKCPICLRNIIRLATKRPNPDHEGRKKSKKGLRYKKKRSFQKKNKM